LPKVPAPDADSLQAAITTVAQRLQDNDTALKTAAQDSFGRLLQALSSEQIKKSVEKGAAKVGPFLKAAWYEAFEEKHAQLTAYHNKGFLTRDFRDLYKRQFKTNSTGEK
ncbi:MAG: type VI secretion system-associated FHA domain protein, partial [Pseudomonadota bacterium]